MKFDEALRLQNFAEHYSIVLGNIGVATRELEQVLKEKEEKLGQVAELKQILSSTEEEILKNKKSLNDARGIIKDSREIEAILAKKKEETDKYIKDNLAELENQKESLKFDIAELSQIINELLDDKEVIEKSISVLLSQSSGLSKDVYILDKEVAGLREERGELRDKTKAVELGHSKALEKHSKELKSIEKQIEESRAKVLDTDNHFAQKEKDISRRENDVLIITRRLHTLFQEVKPGIALKI